MKITRDVIYDLLPAYFAGETSADTRALIEEFFASDPEFGRMAERFRTLHQDIATDASMASALDRERNAFERARTQFRRQKVALMWAVGAAVAFLMAMLTPGPSGPTASNPGFILGIILSWVAAATWFSSGELSLSGRLRGRKRDTQRQG